MLEKELAKGKQVEWFPKLKDRPGGEQQEMVCYSGKGTKFKFVRYVRGKITYGFSQGTDVLSGPFTGCIMAAYRLKDGFRRVCHVSTSQDTSDDCKEFWTEVKTEAGATVEVEFRPFDFYKSIMEDYTQSFWAKQNTPWVYGLITPENTCWSIVVSGGTVFALEDKTPT